MPRVELHGLGGQQSAGGVIEVFLTDDNLGHVAVEPCVGCHIVAVHAVVLAPAILHLPAVRLALFVKVHAGDGHGMVTRAVAVFEAVRLVEIEIGAEQLIDAHAVAIEIAGGT